MLNCEKCRPAFDIIGVGDVELLMYRLCIFFFKSVYTLWIYDTTFTDDYLLYLRKLTAKT